MQGLTIFKSMGQALRCGYQVCGRTENGYFVRTRTAQGWALAIVVIGDDSRPVRSYEPAR